MNNYNTKDHNTTARRSAARSTSNSAVRSIVGRATAHTARTPYHALGGEDGMRIPNWAQHRSVYRVAGRTLYLVETDRVDEAKLDLKQLDHAGWEVQVTKAPAGSVARIALTRRELARAA